MSRLSRFKKAPVIKLPKMGSVSRQKTESEDSDDDFVSKPLSLKSKSTGEKVLSPTVEPSISEYFTKPEVIQEESEKPKPGPSKPKLKEAPKNKNETGTISKRCPKAKKGHNQPSVGSEENVDNQESEVASKAKGFCPFCGKQFADMLTATSHIKSCAKGVPTEQVFAAMQLQEKQIEEWQKLGLEFPGITGAGGGKKPKGTGKARGGGGGGRRRKKSENENHDDEYELAVALSMSLHEELETRQDEQNKFLIESGLENEVKLTEMKPPPPKLTEVRSSGTSTVVKRRGKKIQLDQLPLYTVSEDQKRIIIGERVSKILDEAEEHKVEQVYIRDPIPVSNFGVPRSLRQFHDKEATLWKKSQLEGEMPNESFSILEKPDPHIDLKLTECRDKEMESSIKETPTNSVEPDKAKEIKTVEPMEVPRKLSRRSSFGPNQISTQKASKMFPKLVQDILGMLTCRKQWDVVLYGREEKPIKCHSFMLYARCPLILNHAVEEAIGSRQRKVIPLTCYSHSAVKAFIYYVYTGVAKESEDVLDEVKRLGDAFGLDISENDFSLKDQTQRPACSSVQVQTDIVEVSESSTMTESQTSLDTSAESQELFTSYLEENEVIEIEEASVSEAHSDKEDTVVDVKPRDNSIISIYDDDNDSVDLFEELEQEEGAKVSNVAETSVLELDQEKNDNKEGYLEKSLEDVDKSQVKEKTNQTPSSKSCGVTDFSAIDEFFGDLQPSQSQCHGDEENVNPTPEELKGDDTLFSKLATTNQFDEDDFLEDLLSPKTQTQWRRSSEKRSRSRSPCSDDGGGVYSATQIASLLDKHYAGGNTKELIQATKKQKLDKGSDIDLTKSESSVSVQQSNLGDNSPGDKWGNDDDLFLVCEVDNIMNSHSNLAETPKTNRFKSKKSQSTPNLCSPKVLPNFSNSPFHNRQSSQFDPFADGCDADDSVFAKIPEEMLAKDADDSIFAKIPEEMLAKPESPEKGKRKKGVHKQIDVSRATSQTMNLSITPTSHRKKKAFPKDLYSDEDSFSAGKSQRKGRGGAAKPKPGPKLKLPSKLTASKKNSSQVDTDLSNYPEDQNESEFLSQPVRSNKPKPPVPQKSTATSFGKSPMMNYSLLDTPVLKQELKKYGVRPLPRNKAKAMLKHIYHETHK